MAGIQLTSASGIAYNTAISVSVVGMERNTP
jgi:hypothetical protein